MRAIRKSVGLELLEGAYSVSRLAGSDAVPAWADGTGFVSISRHGDELSIVCLQERVPPGIRSDPDWRCIKFVGPFAFDETGIVLSVIQPLAEGGLGVFVVSTFDGDCLLLKQERFDEACVLLLEAGHRFVNMSIPA